MSKLYGSTNADYSQRHQDFIQALSSLNFAPLNCDLEQLKQCAHAPFINPKKQYWTVAEDDFYTAIFHKPFASIFLEQAKQLDKATLQDLLKSLKGELLILPQRNDVNVYEAAVKRDDFGIIELQPGPDSMHPHQKIIVFSDTLLKVAGVTLPKRDANQPHLIIQAESCDHQDQDLNGREKEHGGRGHGED